MDAIGSALKVHVVSLTLFDRDDREDGELQNIRITGSRGLPGLPPPAIPLNRGPDDKSHIEQVVEWLSTNRRLLDTGELHRWRL